MNEQMTSTLMTKSAFAAHRGVRKSAVSNWIAKGKISDAALVQQGSAEMVDVALAERQLDARTDVHRARNGRARSVHSPVHSAAVEPFTPEQLRTLNHEPDPHVALLCALSAAAVEFFGNMAMMGRGDLALAWVREHLPNTLVEIADRVEAEIAGSTRV